ncbi:hypothetical protein H0H81_005413 [Sphagnurus paluster]|uniref:Carbonic anhydrase n=1 Tax=Sphagnurus paluster TaxID=117069 RepID=A0A9P7K5S8_9AGAR|nr:hypothetical protein H0H81_005413 [Sphagnurus paluster]
MYLLQLLFVASLIATSYGTPNSLIPVANNGTNAQSLVSRSFGYTGITGPLGWSGLSPESAMCSNGTSQSPINLDSRVRNPQINPTVRIKDGSGDFENLGNTVEVKLFGETAFEGKVYGLKQFHFHTPSEHRIKDEYFPLEAHFVHQAVDGTRLVLGVVFEITTNGATTEFVRTLAQHIKKIKVPGSKTRVNGLKFRQIVTTIHKSRLYQYAGSLTTPPCSEGITWLVSQTPLPIDVASYLAFKKIIKFNARFTQNTPGQRNLIEVAAEMIQKRT